jgi:hypothetical protein
MDEYGAVVKIGGEKEIGPKKNWSQCHFVEGKSYITCDRTRSAVVGSRRLSTYAVPRFQQGLSETCFCAWCMQYFEGDHSD